MNLLLQRALGILMLATACALVATAFMPLWDASVREVIQAFVTPAPPASAPPDNPFDDYPDAVSLAADERDAHALGPQISIRIVNPTNYGANRAIVVWTVVDEKGDVIDAVASDGPPLLRDEGARLAATQKFAPFARNGKPVRAQFTTFVPILGPERRPNAHVAFPEIKNWRSLTIGLERQACYGPCPAYKIAIDANGVVEYTGQKFVALQGKHRGSIAPEIVRDLFDRFRNADFYWMLDDYVGRVDHAQSTTLTLAFDGRTRRVTESDGFEKDMPDAVRDLQNAIERAVGIARWTKGNDDTAPSLQAERWPFRSQSNENRAMVAGVAAYGEANALRKLIELGAPVAATAELYQTTSPYDVPETALDAAVVRGDAGILRILLDAKAKWTRAQFGEALLKAAGHGQTEIATALMAAGADAAYIRPNPHPGKGRGEFRGPGHDGRSVLMNAASAGALDLVSTVLNAKPDVNAREEFGWTALHFAAEPRDAPVREPPTADRTRIVEMLVAAGAKLDARTDAGDTPLTVCERYTEVCKALAKAGAPSAAGGPSPRPKSSAYH